MASRQSGSSQHRRHSSRSTNGDSEDVIEQTKQVITSLDDVVSNRPHQWETYLASARSAVTALERLHFFRDPARFAEQVWIIQGLQDYAYHDADTGCIEDIAEFCQASWLRVLRNFPENVEVLTGLGQNWLQRAQYTLARIHHEEGADLSSGGSQAVPPHPDPRRQGPLYVEARGYLQPAVDFFSRAVQSADSLGITTGDLLAAAAESQMSLGNVTAPPADEQFFTQAIWYLRYAAATPGYSLSIYLQQYLDDYGRYV